MVGTILGILMVFVSIVVVLYAAASLFPNLSKLWLAALIATVVLGIIRAFHGWLCVLLCG